MVHQYHQYNKRNSIDKLLLKTLYLFAFSFKINVLGVNALYQLRSHDDFNRFTKYNKQNKINAKIKNLCLFFRFKKLKFY